jgi:hypothetical protein
MTIPKWLLPVISVVAAVAVGVALSIVGAHFASKQVADHPATTEKLPVLEPVASGPLTKAAVKLASAGKLPVSKVTGQATVVRPGASLGSTGLQQAVRRIADGHASGDGTDTPAGSSTATSSPTATPAPTTGSPSGSGDNPTSDDPCSPASRNPPAGCPDGTLQGAIFADTIPPALDFTIEPFSADCHGGGIDEDTGHQQQPVLFRPTVPSHFDVQYRWVNPNDPNTVGNWHFYSSVPTDSDQVNAWNIALANNEPIPNLPPLTACVYLNDMPLTDNIQIIVDGNSDISTETIRHEYVFRASGASILPEVEAETFVSHDYFVAYTESIPTQSVAIQAYDITNAPGSTCADVSGLHVISAQGERLIGPVNPQSTTLNIPLEYTERVANGYVVAAGSVTMVCANWYHGREVPSFDRATPYHSSAIIVRAPDAQLPFLTVGNVGTEGSPATHITASGSTIEGINCGSAEIEANGEPLVGPGHDFERRICSESESAMDSATDDPSLRGEMVVTSDVTVAGGQHVVGQFVIPNPTTVCPDCWVLPQDQFEVPLPDAPGTHTSMGTMLVVRGWDVHGRSGLRNWVSEPMNSVASAAPVPANLPQLDTNNALTVDTADAVGSGAALSFNLRADQDADYTVTLTGVPGHPTCMFGTPSLTFSGHYTIGTRPIPIVFQHLCFRTLYLGSVTLTNDNGSTQWGWQSGNSRWPGFIQITGAGSITFSVLTDVSNDYSNSTEEISFTIDGHTGAPPVQFNSDLTCGHDARQTDQETVPMAGDSFTMHLHFRQLQGAPETTAHGCAVTDGTELPPEDDVLEESVTAVGTYPVGWGFGSSTITEYPQIVQGP